ncbi:MAG: glycoside hydrolase family 13 protein, partial [Clostridiales bacterium]|nr:glycoside hydrolase family 13 protein [Clostridiales bacterium]
MSVPYFDSRDPACKTPFGAVAAGEEVSFSLYLPKNMAAKCTLKLIPGLPSGKTVEIPMEFAIGDLRCNAFRAKFTCREPQLWFYHFELDLPDGRQSLTRGPDNLAIFGGWDGWQLTVYDRGMKTPAALGQGVIYQIFPDRFCASGNKKEGVPADRTLRSDWGGQPEWKPNPLGKVTNSDYFGGDLEGITQKLGYLESLGVTCIYLNPIFEAHSNHRYNTADYHKVDPLLGNEDDFSRLCAEAKKRGIGIILDGVFSHTGSDSIYFNKEGRYGSGGAFRDRKSPYFPWFRFGRWPEEYESWWGFRTLPNVEESNPEYIDFICGEDGVLRHWIGLGASGFRLDVADELPDVFLDALYASVNGGGDGLAVIGEVWEDASNKVSYGSRRRYLLGAQMDSVMNYPFRDALLHYMRYGGGYAFYHSVMRIVENYPPPVLGAAMNSLSTHDTVRAITALGGDPMESHDREWQNSHQTLTEEQYWKGRHLFAIASLLQFGLPGIPCVYYGDEAGMCGYRDPFNRLCYPWGGEDGGLVDFIRTLGKIRADYPIFADALFLPVTFSDSICCFIRKSGKEEILFAGNRTGEPREFALPAGFEGGKRLTS